jgi:hypothetical protein
MTWSMSEQYCNFLNDSVMPNLCQKYRYRIQKKNEHEQYRIMKNALGGAGLQ